MSESATAFMSGLTLRLMLHTYIWSRPGRI